MAKIGLWSRFGVSGPNRGATGGWVAAPSRGAIRRKVAMPCWFAIPVWVVALLPAVSGCNAIRNGWLDPSIVGAFDRSASLEIRGSLTLEDTSPGIPGATLPVPDDLKVIPREYTITSGDTLVVEINELRDRNVPFQAQVQVSSTGKVNLPVVGSIPAEGLTISEFEAAIVSALKDRYILLDPDVTVNPLFLHEATYSIFGIGVSASNNAPLRAGTFPIRHTDLRILEAINQVGGLSEFVTDIYVFRDDHRFDHAKTHTEPKSVHPTESQPAPSGSSESAPAEPSPAIPSRIAAEKELLEGVGPPGSDPQGLQADESIPDDLDPDPTQPYLFVNGEFVPNPAYESGGVNTNPPSSNMPTFDAGTPTVNWSRIAGDSGFRIIRIPGDRLRAGDPEINIAIQGGDVIRIVSGEIGVYYVMGQVNRVGPFAFNAELITLKGAIAAAGGLSGLAWPDRCTVYRRTGMREQMIQVNLDRIFAGKDADFSIQRGDIINVGTHPLAPFLQRLRAWTLPTPVNTVGYSFTYSRNFADVDSFAVKQNPANKPDRFPSLFP